MSIPCILNLPMIDSHNLRILKLAIEEELKERDLELVETTSPQMSPRLSDEEEQCFDLEDLEGNLIRAPKRTLEEEKIFRKSLDNDLENYMKGL